MHRQWITLQWLRSQNLLLKQIFYFVSLNKFLLIFILGFLCTLLLKIWAISLCYVYCSSDLKAESDFETSWICCTCFWNHQTFNNHVNITTPQTSKWTIFRQTFNVGDFLKNSTSLKIKLIKLAIFLIIQKCFNKTCTACDRFAYFAVTRYGNNILSGGRVGGTTSPLSFEPRCSSL